MRVLYDDNSINSIILADTETNDFEASNLNNTVRSKKYRSTQNSALINFEVGTASQGFWDSSSNLISTPDDLTSATWTDNNCTTSEADLIKHNSDFPWFKVVGDGVSTGYVSSIIAASTFTETAPGFTVLAKQGNSTTTRIEIYDNDGASLKFVCVITWSTQNVNVTTGVENNSEWLDDTTVQLWFSPTSITVSNEHEIRLYNENTTTTNYTYYTCPQAEDLDKRSTDIMLTSRTSTNTTTNINTVQEITFDMIIDYKSGENSVSSTILYNTDGTSYIKLYTPRDVNNNYRLDYYDGSTTIRLECNMTGVDFTQRQRICATIDLSSTGVATGSQLIIVPQSSGSLTKDVSWSSNISNAYDFDDTLYTFSDNSTTYMNGYVEYFNIYDGVFTDTITTENDLDTALSNLTLVQEQQYYEQKSINSFYMLDDNITENATVYLIYGDNKVYDYVDSGYTNKVDITGLDNDIILQFFSSISGIYFTLQIQDGYNSDGYIEMSKIFLGDYLSISPSSILPLTQVNNRNDNFDYSDGRQLYADVGENWRGYELSFPRSTKTMIESIRAFDQTVGNHTPFLWLNFDDLDNNDFILPMYCHKTNNIEEVYELGKASYKLTLVEVK